MIHGSNDPFEVFIKALTFYTPKLIQFIIHIFKHTFIRVLFEVLIVITKYVGLTAPTCAYFS